MINVVVSQQHPYGFILVTHMVVPLECQSYHQEGETLHQNFLRVISVLISRLVLKTNEENIECTMANVKMTEVDENEKIETVDLDVDQGDCVGHVGGASGGVYIHN